MLDLQAKVLDLEVEIEALRLQRTREDQEALALPTASLREHKHDANDFTVMTRALLQLIIQLASQDTSGASEPSVEAAQRLLIKQLLSKLGPELWSQAFEAPAGEHDRRLWYLELLEQQVAASEQASNSL